MSRPARLAADPGWARVLAAARRSLERTGGSLDGRISLGAPTDAERLVVIGVTGAHRSAGSGRLTVRLAELDAHLRAAYALGLAEVLALDAPLRDRPGEAKRDAVARDALLSFARQCRHAGCGWYEEWLDAVRRDGTLTRVVRGDLPFEELLRVLDALPADEEPMPVFADRVLDDTKALSDGPLRALAVRAIARWQGTPVPANTEQERALWEAVGVVPDDLASQVLVLNVLGSGGALGDWLTQAAQVGVPIRVTLHQLRLAPLRLRCDEVFVCENPAVVRAATALGPAARPLICTEGMPSAAVHALLGSAGAACIRWRNDFDWTGVRLTAAALARYPNAVPWRMTADDYRPHAGSGPVLLGAPIGTAWDPRLAEWMRECGRAVMEERLLDILLRDLRRQAEGARR
jgi:uncharacterized protein (TIGR02679 family)